MPVRGIAAGINRLLPFLREGYGGPGIGQFQPVEMLMITGESLVEQTARGR
jgi:hypothetical protein